MKRSVLATTGTMTFIAAITGTVALWPSATVLADDDDGFECEEIEGIIVSAADFSTFTTEGLISGDLEGTTAFTGDAGSITPIPSVPNTSSYRGKLSIMTEDGNVDSQSVGVFEAEPGGLGVQFDKVTGGTGAFEGASGVLYFTFVAGPTGATFTSTVTGELCFPNGDDDGDD